MKVRVNETDLNGKPIHDSGEIMTGESYLDIVEGMKLAPFTINLEPKDYMKEVLDKTGYPDFPLPEEPEEAAKTFMLKLASAGFVQFLEDDPYPANLMETLEAIRQSGKTNMLDVPMVVKIALEMNESEVANWVNTHHGEYGKIIFHGRPKETEVK